MRATAIKNTRRERRKNSVRAHLRRTASLPRLSVHRSGKHISAQVIDDNADGGWGRTVCSATTTAKALQGDLSGKNKTQRATVIGTSIAQKAIAAGVTQVVFDRGSSRFHGRVKALADAARAAGLKF
jgi:large subunit ribosomal protein L18